MYNLVARRNVAVGQLRAKGANTKNPIISWHCSLQDSIIYLLHPSLIYKGETTVFSPILQRQSNAYRSFSCD